MTSLGNIALSLKDRVYALKSDYNVYFSLSSSFFGSKSFLHLVLLLTCFVDPLSLGRLLGYEGSGMFALEVLRQAVVGSVADWQLASVRRCTAVGLSSCPFDSSSRDGLDDFWCPQAGC